MSGSKVDLSQFDSEHSLGHKAVRLAWGFVWALLFRPSPRPFFAWRRLLLSLFGAQVGSGVRVYGTARVYYPPNLTLGDFSILGDHTDCYCVDKIEVGAHAIVSQYAFLCSATHDHRKPGLPLRTAPITICEQSWICAGAFIAPGITVHTGAVVGARACVFKDVPAWTVVRGNPAVTIGKRELEESGEPSAPAGADVV